MDRGRPILATSLILIHVSMQLLFVLSRHDFILYTRNHMTQFDFFKVWFYTHYVFYIFAHVFFRYLHVVYSELYYCE